MRCSSCEPLLDEYVDATLEPARAHAIAEHVGGCRACADLLRRLRIVDGLLATARKPALADDFTYETMAAVRSLPLPSVARRPLLPLAAVYLVGAWVAAVTALTVLWPGAATTLRGLARAGAGAFQALGQSTHVLWPAAPIAVSVVVSLLSIDVLLFAALVLFYRRVRPRLTARLAATAEVR